VSKTHLVTGAAGFIGMHTCLRLLARGDDVVGVDNLNDYYDVRLKQARLARLQAHPRFRFASWTWPTDKPCRRCSRRKSPSG